MFRWAEIDVSLSHKQGREFTNTSVTEIGGNVSESVSEVRDRPILLASIRTLFSMSKIRK